MIRSGKQVVYTTEIVGTWAAQRDTYAVVCCWKALTSVLKLTVLGVVVVRTATKAHATPTTCLHILRKVL